MALEEVRVVHSWPSSFADLTLINPRMLLWGIAVIAALWVKKRRGPVALDFAPLSALLHKETGVTSWRSRFAFLSTFLNLAGVLMIVFVLARPAELVANPEPQSGIDILLCLDKSSSMRSKDMSDRGRRLDVAVASAERFIDDRKRDRLGLIGFARFPDLICPLTRDNEALKASLENLALVKTEGSEDATGIGTALAKAAQVMLRSDAASKVIVLLTDGVENVSSAASPNEIAPVHAAQLCQELGLRVHTVVAGSGGVEQGDRVQQLDTRQIRLVAEKTGGQFFEAGDELALAQVFADINQLETTPRAEPEFHIRDCYLGFLVTALALVLLSRFCRSTMLEIAP